NPHNFRHWNLNPARLPVPPRPREKHPIRPRCRGRRAYNMRPPVRSKKMAACEPALRPIATGQVLTKMVRIGRMASPVARPDFPLARRDLMAALGAAALGPALPATARAQGRTAVALQAKADRILLRPGGPETPVWSLGSSDLRFKRGEVLDVTFGNELPVAAA